MKNCHKSCSRIYFSCFRAPGRHPLAIPRGHCFTTIFSYFPSTNAEEDGGRCATGDAPSSWFPGTPEETGLVSQPRLTPEEAESLFVAVVEAWSSLRCVRTFGGYTGGYSSPQILSCDPPFRASALTTDVHSSRIHPPFAFASYVLNSGRRWMAVSRGLGYAISRAWLRSWYRTRVPQSTIF